MALQHSANQYHITMKENIRKTDFDQQTNDSPVKIKKSLTLGGLDRSVQLVIVA